MELGSHAMVWLRMAYVCVCILYIMCEQLYNWAFLHANWAKMIQFETNVFSQHAFFLSHFHTPSHISVSALISVFFAFFPASFLLLSVFP